MTLNGSYKANGGSFANGGTVAVHTFSGNLNLGTSSNPSFTANGGRGGSVILQSAANLNAEHTSIESKGTNSNIDGNGGVAQMDAGVFGTGNLTYSGTTDVSGSGTGVGGAVLMSARNSLTLGDSADAHLIARGSATSNITSGGFIGVTAQEIKAGTGAVIADASSTAGSGGLVSILSDAAVSFGAPQSNSSITATGGNEGNGGSINISAAGSVVLAGGANANATGKGNGGQIGITTTAGLAHLAGSVTADAVGDGQGGDIALSAPGDVLVDGRVSAQAQTAGSGGHISLESGTQSITVQQFISASSTGSQGDGGAIDIRASLGNLTVGGAVTADADGTGNGGTILIDPIEVHVGSELSAEGKENGGKIKITRDPATQLLPQAIVIIGDVDLSGGSDGGNGGQLELEADGVIRILGKVDVSSQFAMPGSVIIRANQSGVGLLPFKVGVGLSGNGITGAIDATGVLSGEAADGTTSHFVFLEDKGHGGITVGDDKIRVDNILGSPGTVNLNAPNGEIVMPESFGFTSFIGDHGMNLAIQANKITFQGNAEINSSSAQGRGGRVWIATNQLSYEDSFKILATGNQGGEARFGPNRSMTFEVIDNPLSNIVKVTNSIGTGDLTFSGDGPLTVTTGGTAKSGSIAILANGLVTMQSATAGSSNVLALQSNGPSTASEGQGTNNIQITSNGLRVDSHHLVLEANGIANGNAGIVIVESHSTAHNLSLGLSSGQIEISAAAQQGSGNGGLVIVDTDANLSVDGAALSVKAGTSGDGGAIRLLAPSQGANFGTITISGELSADGGTDKLAGSVRVEGNVITVNANSLIHANGSNGAVLMTALTALNVASGVRLSTSDQTLAGGIRLSVQSGPINLGTAGDTALLAKSDGVGGRIIIESGIGQITLGRGALLDTSGGNLSGTITFSSFLSDQSSGSATPLVLQNDGSVIAWNVATPLTNISLLTTGSPQQAAADITVTGTLGTWDGALTGQGATVQISTARPGQDLLFRNLEATGNMTVSTTGSGARIHVAPSITTNPSVIVGGALQFNSAADILLGGVIDAESTATLNAGSTVGNIVSTSGSSRIQSTEKISLIARKGVIGEPDFPITTSAKQLTVESFGSVTINHLGNVELVDSISTNGQIFSLSATGNITQGKGSKQTLSAPFASLNLHATGGSVGQDRQDFIFDAAAVSATASTFVHLKRVSESASSSSTLTVLQCEASSGDLSITSDESIFVQSASLRATGDLTLQVKKAAGQIELGTATALFANGQISLYIGNSVGNPKPVSTIITPSGTLDIFPTATVQLPEKKLDTNFSISGSNTVNSGTRLLLNPGKGVIILDSQVQFGTLSFGQEKRDDALAHEDTSSPYEPVAFVQHAAPSSCKGLPCLSTALLATCTVQSHGNSTLLKEGDYYSVENGDFLFFINEQTDLRVAPINIKAKKGTVLFVARTHEVLKIVNLTDVSANGVKLEFAGRTINMKPGQQLVAGSEPAEAQLPRRKPMVLPLGAMYAELSDVSLPAMLQEVPILRSMRASADSHDRLLLSPVLKMAACLLHTTQYKGPYSR